MKDLDFFGVSMAGSQGLMMMMMMMILALQCP